MFQRPAFVVRFLNRFPDPLATRTQLVAGSALSSGVFALVLVLGGIQLDQRRCAEVARTRAETLATTAGLWLDGDAHALLGADPEKRLADLGAQLALLSEKSAFEGTLRTLRAKASEKTALTSSPGASRRAALEVVLAAGEGSTRGELDYEPWMAPAFLEGESVSQVQAGRVRAVAPLLDSWNATAALVLAESSATAPLWRRILFGTAAGVLGALGVAAAVWLARRRADALEPHFQGLEFGLSELGRGVVPPPFPQARRAPRELQRLAQAAEAVRRRVEAEQRGEPLPTAPAAPEGAPARTAELGEASEFDLGLLVQQLGDPARRQALTRGLEFRVQYPDGLPTQLRGYPLPLYRALEGLVQNGLRATDVGQVTLKVSSAGQGPEGFRLRFEVSDTSPGIAFKEQQDLAATLLEAAGATPTQSTDPLHAAASFARALGGELAFESQPGQGSRFGFTCAFAVPGLRTATAFQPRRAALRTAG